MKKTVFIVCISVILTGPTVFFLSSEWSGLKKQDIYIAFAGGINGGFKAGTQEAVNAINLYLNKINKAGGIKGKQVKLRIFDDKDQPAEAKKIASEIGEGKDIVFVIGHVLSFTSLAAGKIYKKQGVPILTASASAKAVTMDNEWYFRIIPHNGFQGEFIAHYCRISGSKAVSFIFQKDEYGLGFAEPFEKTVRDLGLEIKVKAELDTKSRNLDEACRKIADELKPVEEPGIIFLALYPDYAEKFIVAFKDSGKNYTIIGTAAFASEAFISRFRNLPNEQSRPGYYSDNIYGISPFLIDIANEKAYIFREEYKKKYREEPGWMAASHYDAAAIAVEALRKSDIQDDGTVQQNRKKIRDLLAGMSTVETGIKGVSGYLYFDKNGDCNRPLAVGFYKKQRFIPTFSLYQTESRPEKRKNILKNILEGESILIGNSLLNKSDVVYTGIAVNEICNLNLKKGTFTADFYLWFRYKGNFEDADIRFVNAVEPVRPGPPISDTVENGIRVRLYRIRADFRIDTDFSMYPFDSQTVSVQFCHERRTREELIYVKDVWGEPDTVRRKHGGRIKLESEDRWKLGEVSSYQDIVTYSSSLGIPHIFNSWQTINYSRFNTSIRLDRRNFREIMLLLPIVLMMTGLYAVCFIPSDRYRIRVLSFTAILTATIFFHRELATGLQADYMTIVGYVLFTTYMLTALSVLLTGLLFIFHRQGNTKKQKQIIRAEKILYPCLFLIAGLMMIFTG